MARSYNFIYKKLVKSDEDLIGHIAYSLYKSDKIQYIEQFKANNNGKELDESDIKLFNDVSNIDHAVDRYRNTAVAILQNFTSCILDAQVDSMQADYENYLKKVIKPLKTKWWEAIVQSVIGAFVFAIILAAFAFVVQYKGSDLKVTIEPTTTIEQNSSE